MNPLLAPPIVFQAYLFADRAHAGQFRKFTGQAYIHHPEEVATILKLTIPDLAPEVWAASLLHDAIEDTAATHADLTREFGRGVADLVVEVTDTTTLADGNRARRVELNIQRRSTISADAQNITCADILSNCRDVRKLAPDFARVYLKEKLAMLRALDRADLNLWGRAVALVAGEMNKLDF
jgi:(p)ppGpp synthase/HD superfamily hydrolase